jgi:hypothetical protein
MVFIIGAPDCAVTAGMAAAAATPAPALTMSLREIRISSLHNFWRTQASDTEHMPMFPLPAAR